MPFRDAHEHIQALSPAARDVLAAAGSVLTPVFSYHSLSILTDQIPERDRESYEPALQELCDQEPKVMLKDEGLIALTNYGLQLVHGLYQMTFEPPDLEPESNTQPLRFRGSRNREMRKYAGEIGGKFLADRARCTMPDCGHEEYRFVKKGGKLLCQFCFEKGVRF